MNDLGLEIDTVVPWFAVEPQAGYTRVAVAAEYTTTWDDILCDAVRRCYISDEQLAERAHMANTTPAEIVAALLPDPGSIMSGDFGEIVGYIYLASREVATAV